MKRMISSLLLANAVLAAPAFAHDPKLHKGPKVEGTVASVAGDRVEVGTDSGPVSVTLNTETKYEMGEGGEKATRATLAPGQRVMVTGHKLESGQLVATDVMIHPGGDSPVPHGHGK